MADPRKPVNIFELIADASAKPEEVVVRSPIPPVVVQKKTPVPKKTAEVPPPKATIVPQAQPTQAAIQEQAPTQESGSFLSNLFSSSKVEPGEYSTGRNIGTRAVQFLGNFGNSLAGEPQSNVALNQAFAKARQDYMDKDPNSRSSVLYRGMAQRMGLPIRGDESAYNLKEQMPNVKEFLQSRDLDLRERMASMKGLRGPEKTPMKSREEEAEVKSFKDALREYQRSVKDIGLLDISGQGKAKAESQRANLILQLKNMAKTGALDQGMIDIANDLLPEASYTRDGKVDAKINSYIDTLDRNYLNKAKATGYQPEMYKSERELKEKAGQSSAQINEAKKWLAQNPNDPRAEAIRQRLGL